MNRRIFLSAAAATALAGCGFKLRQAPDFAFDAILINAATTSTLGAELRRNLLSSGKVKVLQPAAAAAAVLPAPSTVAVPEAPASTPLPLPGSVTLDVLLEQREKVVVGLNASGQVTEFQLRMRLKFKLRTPAGKELIPETELLQQRDISFNETAVLSKEAEESLLYRDMQSDLVQQLMRRLAAIKTI
jgi:LPS-assembly lipoprotein